LNAKVGCARGTLSDAAEPDLSGDIVHQDTAYPGQHAAILDPELWQIVQNKLAVHRQERALAVGAEAPSLSAGLIVDAGGNRMTPTHAQRKPSDTATKRRRRSISTVPADAVEKPGFLLIVTVFRLRCTGSCY
jgi:hypothetical protein